MTGKMKYFYLAIIPFIASTLLCAKPIASIESSSAGNWSVVEVCNKLLNISAQSDSESLNRGCYLLCHHPNGTWIPTVNYGVICPEDAGGVSGGEEVGCGF